MDTFEGFEDWFKYICVGIGAMVCIFLLGLVGYLIVYELMYKIIGIKYSIIGFLGLSIFVFVSYHLGKFIFYLEDKYSNEEGAEQ